MLPTLLVLPWRRTRDDRPAAAVLFASRIDAAGLRPRWRLLTGGIALRRAVLRAPGALGVSMRAHPLSGRYYTMSLWSDRESLLEFARGPAHRASVTRMTAPGPARGVLETRAAGPGRPRWRETLPWLAALPAAPLGRLPAAGPGVERGP